MDIQLIQGQFDADDAIEIIAQMIHIKIRYHEKKISKISNEEDIKNRENKIKRLQKELFEVRHKILTKNSMVKIDAVIHIG